MGKDTESFLFESFACIHNNIDFVFTTPDFDVYVEELSLNSLYLTPSA